MGVIENLKKIEATIPEGVTLVAVSKQKPLEMISQAYSVGQRIFAENRHKELAEKYQALPKDIVWHFIGTLQRSNVKYVVPYASLIHSVDSQKLIECIDKECGKINKCIDILLEIFIAEDETKWGWSSDELNQFLGSEEFKSLKNIRVRGVMGMATYSDDTDKIAAEFKELKECFDTLKAKYFSNNSHFDTISAGMSGDYQIAIAHGSNMVRVGSSIFIRG